MEQDREFIKHLQDEKLRTQEWRTTYTLRKLTFVVSFLGLGFIKAGEWNLSFILYVVPFIAIGFDLYILGEDYSVKRIGGFLGEESSSDIERKWENWVAKHRDPFAPFAMPFLTTIVTVCSGIGILIRNFGDFIWWQWILSVAWIVFTLIVTWRLYFGYKSLRTRITESLKRSDRTMRTNSSMVQVFPQRKNEYLEQLRFSLKAADYILDETVFRKIQQLFLKYIEDSQYSEMLGREFSESDRTEFLLNVDSKKLTVYPSEQLIKEYRTICNKYKNFRFWFQEKEDKESKRIVLLVARWLAHLAGFRHQCVHIFLDHPTLEGYTLVQIRSFNKSESPGCFDIPIGGHVKDGESLKETCKKELKEELNIDLLLDIEDFEQIGTYNYHDSPQHTNFHNIELRTVFLGRLKTEAMTKIKFVDKEVSAICVFAMPELSVLIKNFPKRIASGLKDSLPVYIQYKNQRKVHNNK